MKEISKDSLELCLSLSIDEDDIVEANEFREIVCALKGIEYHPPHDSYEDLGESPPSPKPSMEEPPTLDLKPLPSHLRYTFLGESSTLSVIISSSLTQEEESKLLKVLKDHKQALGWTIFDIRGISLLLCTH